MTADEIRTLVQTYQFTNAIFVVVDSLPDPYQSDFLQFLHGSAVPIGDGRSRYAYPQDFERWLENSARIRR